MEGDFDLPEGVGEALLPSNAGGGAAGAAAGGPPPPAAAAMDAAGGQAAIAEVRVMLLRPPCTAASRPARHLPPLRAAAAC